MRLRPDVAVHLVAARVSHRLGFRQLVRILALADRRVIVRDLLDPIVPELVEAGVADVADRRPAILDDGDGEDARHARPLRPHRGEAMDLVVGDRDRLPHAIGGRSGLAFEARSQHRERHVGSLATGGLSAHAVDDGEDAARRRRWWQRSSLTSRWRPGSVPAAAVSAWMVRIC